MKKFLCLLLTCTILLSTLTSCKKTEDEYTKYSTVFFNLFDTAISLVSYQESQEKFDELSKYTEERFAQLNKLYDIYNDYDGINNVKTINDNAGIAPVKVDKEIIDLILFSKDWYEKSNKQVNIAMGSVLKVWHDVREEYNESGTATLPSLSFLKEQAEHTDISKVEVDPVNMTVFIKDAHVRLDVGAVAKGFATEIICDELSQNYDNFAISAGGNVKTHGCPKDESRKRWGVGIQNPAVDSNYDMVGGNMDMAYFNTDMSVVCSGGYQRNFILNGRRYHHLIDPDTLFPEEYYQGVSIICEDSGVADALSTAVFLSTSDEALALIESIPDTECVLVLFDGTTLYSSGVNKYLASFGVSNQDE
ncbi:MAG: FAD:protein FMN transferase [Oscillospiraceae bacterium]